MSSEIQNKKTSLANKLDELEYLQGESAKDLRPSWENLQSRISKNEIRRLPLWYWVAAACFVIVSTLLFIPSLKNTKVKTGVSVNIPERTTKEVRKADDAPITINKAIEIEDAINKPSISKVDKKSGVRERTNSPRVHVDVEKTEITSDNAAGILDNKEPVLKEDTASKNNIAVTIKPALRMIHINELANTGNLDQVWLRENDKISKIDASNKSSDVLIKIKINPSN